MIHWRSSQVHRLLRVLLIGALAGCVLREQRGIPLYPGAPRARSAVAILMGPVSLVDGQEVGSKGRAFELLPGCHIVEIGGRTGEFDSRYGGWAATVPPLTYAFLMRGNGTYAIAFEPDPSLGVGPTGTGRIVARERNAGGEERIVPPVQSQASIADCRRWVP
jgi:hypothetical protein